MLQLQVDTSDACDKTAMRVNLLKQKHKSAEMNLQRLILSSFQYKRVCFDRAFLPWTTTAHACAHIFHIWVSTLQQLCEGKRDGGREREWERSKQPWGRRQPSLCCGAVAKDSRCHLASALLKLGGGETSLIQVRNASGEKLRPRPSPSPADWAGSVRLRWYGC